MQFTVISSGDHIVNGIQRAAAVQRIAIGFGVAAKITTTPNEEPSPPAYIRAHYALWHLTLWGLHHSHREITTSAIAQRIGVPLETINRYALEWVSKGFMAHATHSESGLIMPNTYNLTPAGLKLVTCSFDYFVRGCRIAIRAHTKEQAIRIVKTIEAQVPGIIIPSGRKKLPYTRRTISLAACWLIEASELTISSGHLSSRLGLKTIEQEFYDSAISARMLKRLGRGKVKHEHANQMYYKLTPIGGQVAQNYLGSLLLR